MRTTVSTLINHRHSHTHPPAPHIPLGPGHTTHPPGRRPERHLQPNRIPITTNRTRHKLPTELERIEERHHCLLAVHLITLITGTIICLVHPGRNRYPEPTDSPPLSDLKPLTPQTAPHPPHPAPPHPPQTAHRKTARQGLHPQTTQRNPPSRCSRGGNRRNQTPGNRPSTADARSIIPGILSQERGQPIRYKLLISIRAQHHPSIRSPCGTCTPSTSATARANHASRSTSADHPSQSS